jgi:hypothetical protein
MKNTLVIESSDIKFIDFYNDTQISVFTKFYGDDWVYEVRELKNLITQNDAQSDITFSDDSLVLIAYNIMIRVGKFEPKMYHWWLVRRYVEVYQSRDYKEMQDLYDYVSTAMPLLYAGLELDEIGSKKYNELRKNVLTLHREGFELPKFIVDYAEIEQKDVTQEWQELLTICEIMVEETEGYENKQWQELLETCKIMVE